MDGVWRITVLVLNNQDPEGWVKFPYLDERPSVADW